MTTKKRSNDDGESARPAKKRTTTTKSSPAKRTGAPKTAARTPRPAGGSAKPPARRGAARVEGRPAGPRIRASHSTVPDAPASGGGRKLHPLSVDTGGPRRTGTRAPAGRGALALKAPGGPRKAPLAAPKRSASAGRRAVEVEPREAGPSNAARELALALAAAAIDKKAVGIEILDVTGKVDYADFLVVMTGRSDRHVHAIATGIEDAMRQRKVSALSIEGLSTANWVLIDFSDVVVHVFQEEARALYDIEGLWIDAGRVPVPDAEGAGLAGGASLPQLAD